MFMNTAAESLRTHGKFSSGVFGSLHVEKRSGQIVLRPSVRFLRLVYPDMDTTKDGASFSYAYSDDEEDDDDGDDYRRY